MTKLNSIYQHYGQQTNPYAQIIEQAKAFKQSFRGSPRDEVQKLLNSGQMTQADFNKLSQTAGMILQNCKGQF